MSLEEEEGGAGGDTQDLLRSKDLDSEPLQKNGQISSMTSLNCHLEDSTLTEVGQPDSVSVAQKEEAPETMDTIKDEVAPQVKGEKVEKVSPDDNDIAIVEEKAAEEKQDEANEVGFKKIFRFVGFKFTLKKDKNEEKDPVKLLTVRDKEGEEISGADMTEETKEQAATAEEVATTEEKAVDMEASITEGSGTEDTDKTEVPAEGAVAEAVDGDTKVEELDKESESSPPSQDVTSSPFRKLFTGGLFSNLRKKASVKKTKEEEEKETTAEGETTKTDETAEAVEGEKGDVEDMEPPAITPEEVKSASESEVTAEITTPAADNTDEPKPVEEKDEAPAEEEKAQVEVTTETEVLSPQEKAKPQGSPLKKLFTGAGLKKLSTKKQKSNKEAEAKLNETGEKTNELQSSSETEEGQKHDSGASSPEDSGEHVIGAEATQAEASPEAEGEVTSDGEKKKDGIIAWSSFKKLVTPKKRVKRSSESDEEATAEKPVKSATLSSTESAVFVEKCSEDEPKEDNTTEEEPKTENIEKLESSTEEPKKKMDSSVSWDALMCMGGAKKRTRRTSDSDDETKLEEEAPPVVEEEEQETKADESPVITSAEGEDTAAVALEPTTGPPERESAWDTLKRFVLSKNKPKVEEKTEDTSDQILSESEVQKEESSFSLRKFFHGRRKKKVEKQTSNEMEEDSDTPAVVPLSEYEAEQPEDKNDESSGPAATQTKASPEDRSPSWIPAIVEDVDDIHDQLSDIPEEAENAATPKSADTTIADDEAEDPSPLSVDIVGHECTGLKLSTAEVMPLVPPQTDETTPVPEGPKSETAEMVLEAVVEKVSEITGQTVMAVKDVPIEVASAETENEPAIEHSESQTKIILQPHSDGDAMAICTGLVTKEIAEVALEKPIVPVAECVTVVTAFLCTDVAIEKKTDKMEQAIATEDLVLEAQVHQVEATELEPHTESLTNEMAEVQTASESQDLLVGNIALTTGVPDQYEIMQPAEVDENSHQTQIVNSIKPVEEIVYNGSAEITEPTVGLNEKEMEVEQFTAVEENVPVQEIVTAFTQEIISASVETEQVEIKEEVLMEQPSDTVADTPVEIVAKTSVEAAESEVSINVVEQKSGNMEEQANAIEEESMIAQAAIVNAMETILEFQSPTTPTTPITAPVQALQTTENDSDLNSEKPIATDTPVAVVCEAPAQMTTATKSPKLLHTAIQVTDNLPIEVTRSFDGQEEEEKPVQELKQAVEVKESEETVLVEEVVELKLESQTGAGCEEGEKGQSTEEVATEKGVPAETKDAAVSSEEVKPEQEESEPETKIQISSQGVLQMAQLVEDVELEEEAVEFDADGNLEHVEPAKEPAGPPAVLEEHQTQASKEVATSSQDATDEVMAESPVETEKVAVGKCAEVMAQVIEVIEEAVKEIEPISTEISAAS